MSELPPLEPLPIVHDWFRYRGMTCCRQCGFVQNDKNKDALCKGRVKVELRQSTGGKDDN